MFEKFTRRTIVGPRFASIRPPFTPNDCAGAAGNLLAWRSHDQLRIARAPPEMQAFRSLICWSPQLILRRGQLWCVPKHWEDTSSVWRGVSGGRRRKRRGLWGLVVALWTKLPSKIGDGLDLTCASCCLLCVVLCFGPAVRCPPASFCSLAFGAHLLCSYRGTG